MSRQYLVNLITTMARAYGLPPESMVALALAESDLDPDCEGDQGTSIGLFQIQRIGSPWETVNILSRWASRDPRLVNLRNPVTNTLLTCIGHRHGCGHWWHAWVNVPKHLRPPRDHWVWRHAPEEWLAAE